MPIQDLIQNTRTVVDQPDTVVMLEETLPTLPSTTLSDFAVWKADDRDDSELESAFKSSLYPAASIAMGIPLSVNHNKWIQLVLGIVFALVVLFILVSSTQQAAVLPATWAAARPSVLLSLPFDSETKNSDRVFPALSDQSVTSGSIILALTQAARYGMGYTVLPSTLIQNVKRTFSQWIGWLRAAFEESINLEM